MVHPYLEPFLSEDVQNEGGYFVPSGSDVEICETAPIYCPRNPEESILYGVVAAQLQQWQGPNNAKEVKQTQD